MRIGPQMTTEAMISRSHQSSPDANDNYTRLHITPLDEELLKIIIPTSARDSARDISIHSIETFPENRYGFVSLPQTEAEKLQRKLNGVIVKGAKMRIEKARPEKQQVVSSPKSQTGDTEPARKNSSPKETKKDKKRVDKVLEGVLLQDRKVKRGWTEAADTKRKRRKTANDDSKSSKKSRPKSKYTEQEECLLKTKVPPNAVGNLSASAAAGSKKKKKQQTTSTREVTVHEFEKTTKFPSFLKENPSGAAVVKSAREFVEGKGWVDDDGELVEAVPLKTNKMAKPKVEPEPDSTSSSDGESSSDEEEEEEEQESEATSATSSSGSDSSAATQDGEQQDTPAAQSPSRPKTALGRPSSSSAANLVIKIPPPPTTPGKDIHPLEALYKKRTSVNDGPPQQAFSFFGTNTDEADDALDRSDAPMPPLTPYTRADLEWRNLRSAAPTPDTAHSSRAKYFWSPAESQDALQTEDALSPTRNGDDTEQDQKDNGDGDGNGDGASDFQAWFWQNRRDLIGSWMTRRKTAAKDKRHRENKARASRTI